MDVTASYSFMDRSVKLPPFATGAVVLFGWFVWHAVTNPHYNLEEWLVFYVIALLSWQPIAAWLAKGVRWVPAAELFFLLHLPYYVAPFLRASDYIKIETDTAIRLKMGLVIALFLVVCRLCYRVPREELGKSNTSHNPILNRKIVFGRGNHLGWWGLMGWFGFTACNQLLLLPELGSFFNIFRTLIASYGTIGMFVLFYEMGCGRLPLRLRVYLVAIVMLGFLFEVASGFLIGGAIRTSTATLAFYLGRKKLPLVTMLIAVGVLAMLHMGKADMRAEFWDEGKNYSSVRRNPLDVYQFWISRSWNHFTAALTTDEQPLSLLERGNLFPYLILVVRETPVFRAYMKGTTYQQTALIFVPRFLWPGKPRASTPDETLAIYYGFQTIDSVEVTAVGLGRISEAWANFGWIGICIAGAVMGVILQIPTKLSAGFSTEDLRYLLALPFVIFAMNLEACLGYAIHALVLSLGTSLASLWLVSKPADPRFTV